MNRASLIAGAVGCGLLAASAYGADGPELPPGPNRALVYGQCRTCHDLQYLVESAGVPRDTWSDLLDSMKQYGLRLSADQRAKILDYLGTYLGPNPPKPAADGAPAAAAGKVDGAEIFADQCAACHQANGQGAAGQFPPLARNSDLFLARDYPARVVLFGLSGKITIGGESFDGVMPPLDVLKDEEIAAVVRFVRSAWGNAALRPKGLQPADAAMVASLRKNKASADQVLAYRQSLRAQPGAAKSAPLK
jgi:mono/diheme cytochrome c family protein